MSRTFNFNSQLKVGDKGERIFSKCYSERQVIKAERREFDFYIDGGYTVELKTDTYSMLKTVNFFMEKYGNEKTKALGGPWRAAADRIDYFVYMYLQERTFFWFEPVSLVKFLDKFVRGKSFRRIDNKTWAALGYLIPRREIEQLCLAVDKF